MIQAPVSQTGAKRISPLFPPEIQIQAERKGLYMKLQNIIKGIRSNPVTYLVQTQWRYAEKERSRIVVYGVLSAIALTLSLLEPLVIGRLMNSVQLAATQGKGDALLSELTLCLGIYLALGIVFWAFHGPSRIIERDVAFSIRRNFQLALFKMVTELPLQWHRDTHSGSTIDRISKSSNALSEFCDSSFETIHMIVRFVGCLVILTLFMPIAGGILIVATGGIIVIVVLFDRVLIRQYREINARYHHLAEAVHDYLTNIRTVISLRLEQSVAQEVRKRLGFVRPVVIQSNLMNEIKWGLASVLTTLVTCAVLFGYGYHVVASNETIMTGTFFTLFDYLRRIGEAFFVFCFKYGNIVQQSSSVRAVEPILEEYRHSVTPGHEATLPTQWKKLDIVGLTYSHNDNEDRTSGIEEVSFTLERGKSYAFIGESGSGKSTTLSILRALYTPQSGAVHCDGQLLPYGVHHIAHHTTLIPQDPEIFSVTIRENVTMGLSVEESEITEAIRLAQFLPVIERLPKGVETSIAEKGVNLSGGEKQRLALARGFLFARKSDVVLLDEPTSSVDVFNERIIYENILAQFADSCVVSTIHKLYLLSLFDEIVVFSQGRVVERGSLESLLAQKGTLASLWERYQEEIE